MVEIDTNLEPIPEISDQYHMKLYSVYGGWQFLFRYNDKLYLKDIVDPMDGGEDTIYELSNNETTIYESVMSLNLDHAPNFTDYTWKYIEWLMDHGFVITRLTEDDVTFQKCIADDFIEIDIIVEKDKEDVVRVEYFNKVGEDRYDSATLSNS